METEVAAATSGDGATDSNLVFLGPRDSLVGKLNVQGALRVAGTAEGELQASGDVSIEDSATVNAAVQGRDVAVRGTVTGDVTARRLLLAGKGSISGNVRTGRLTIEDGAVLNGNVSMTGGRRG